MEQVNLEVKLKAKNLTERIIVAFTMLTKGFVLMPLNLNQLLKKIGHEKDLDKVVKKLRKEEK